MGDKAKLNPFQSLDDGIDESEPYGGYKPPEADDGIPTGPVKGNKKKKAPARASKALPTAPTNNNDNTNNEPANPFDASSSETPKGPVNPFLQSQPQPQPPASPPPPQHVNPFTQQAYANTNTNNINTSSNISPPFAPAPNPFISKPAPSAPPQSPYTQSSYSQPAYSQPPAYTGSSSISTREDLLAQRELDLNRREQALAARERELAEREAKAGKGARTPNWPKWPKAILFHDIDVDIPADKQRLVRQAYYLWFAKMFFVLWNLVVVVALLIVDGRVGDFVLGIFYLIVWSLVLFLNYRLLYNACRRGKALSYGFFLFWFGIEFLVFIFWTIGLKGSGMTGILWMVWCFGNDEKVVGFMCLCCVIFTGFAAIFNLYIWIKARTYYSQCGGNKKAQKQLNEGAVQTAANNPDVVVDIARNTGY